VAQLLLVCALVTAMTLASLHLGGSLRTMETRIQLWQTTLYAAQTNPLVAILGSGQQIVWNASARLADLQYANAHNVFLNQVVNFGFPGAAFYLLAFALAIRQSKEAMRLAGDSELRRLAQIANTCLLAMAGQYFFEPAADASGLAVVCFFFMAVSAVVLREARKT
jgi:O-antigen ligase